MDVLWLRITNVVTTGNLTAALSIILFGIYGYYRIRRYIAQQHYEFIQYLKSLTVEQTATLEACIHKIPAHPESPENKEVKTNVQG